MRGPNVHVPENLRIHFWWRICSLFIAKYYFCVSKPLLCSTKMTPYHSFYMLFCMITATFWLKQKWEHNIFKFYFLHSRFIVSDLDLGLFIFIFLVWPRISLIGQCPFLKVRMAFSNLVLFMGSNEKHGQYFTIGFLCTPMNKYFCIEFLLLNNE